MTISSNGRVTRFGSILFLCCFQFFLAEQLARAKWTLPYSFASNFVSDLGAIRCSPMVCSPWHELMNSSFVLQGMLIAGGAVITWRRWSLAGKAGMVLLVVCGIGVTIVGLVPEDSDDALHRVGAAAHFLGGGLGMMAAGLSLRRWFRWYSIVIGVAVTAATVALGLGSEAWLASVGVGAIERVAAYGIAGWMTSLGLRLLFPVDHLPQESEETVSPATSRV